MSRPVSDPEPSHQAFYDFRQMRSVPIRSIVGQTQFYLSHVLPRPGAPEEDLLLCRYANTIDEPCGQLELRQLKRLVRHLKLKISERRFGHVDPVVAREVEKEIVLRNEPDYAAGHDLTPAMRLLDGYERDGPVFTQPERNLLLRSAVLQNGTLLFPAQTGWWRSGIRKADQTFTAPHFYKADGEMGFEIADEEHRILFQQEPTQPEPEQGMTMGMSL